MYLPIKIKFVDITIFGQCTIKIDRHNNDNNNNNNKIYLPNAQT